MPKDAHAAVVSIKTKRAIQCSECLKKVWALRQREARIQSDQVLELAHEEQIEPSA